MGCAGKPRRHLQSGSHGEHTAGGHEEGGSHQAHTIRCPVTPSFREPPQQWPEWHPGSPSHAVQTLSVWRRQGEEQAAFTVRSGRRFKLLPPNAFFLKVMMCYVKLHRAAICFPILVVIVLFCCHLLLSSPPHQHCKHVNSVKTQCMFSQVDYIYNDTIRLWGH